MATLWNYRSASSSGGPVPFRALVKLVRDGDLTTDDLVREEWNDEWRAAALAVGLFHMAGREDLVQKWEAEQLRIADELAEIQRRELESIVDAAPDNSEEESVPTWVARLREMDAIRRAEELEKLDEYEIAALRELSQDLVAEWEAEQLQRAATYQVGPFSRFFRNLFSNEVFHLTFRWSITLALANATAIFISKWSTQSLQRFPTDDILSGKTRLFPFWGECTPEMYLFLLSDAVLVAGAAGYCLARLFEAITDE